MRGHRGQSTLEYILVLAAIIVAVIVAANMLVRPAVDKSMKNSSMVIENSTQKLQEKLGLQ